jgi:hypothetical protein
MRSLILVLLTAALMSASAEAAQPTAEKSTAKRISDHIQQSGQLRNYRIGVTYQNGIATLAGTVTSPEQRDAAVRLAKEIAGVRRVESQLDLVVQPGDSAQEGISALYVRPSTNSTAPSAAARGNRSGVVQAYGGPKQFHPGASNRPKPLRRGNGMPLPTMRTAPDPAVRPASADCYQAGGPHAGGYAGMGGAGMGGAGMMAGGGGMPSGVVPASYGRGPSYENPSMPGYAWPSYASYPNYAALTYPQQYSPTAWPYIGPFYPYPQVPLAWRKVSLEWDDGWWFLDFSAHNSSH